MKEIIIMDFAKAEIHIYPYEKKENIDEIEQFIIDKGHRNYQWMIVNAKDFSLTFHKLK